MLLLPLLQNNLLTGGAVAHQGEATFQGAGNLSALVTLRLRAEARFQGDGTLSALAMLRQAAAATFQGDGTLSALAIKYKLAAATFEGVGSFSADAVVVTGGVAHQGEATLQGAGSLSADTLQFIFIQPDADSIDGGWTNQDEGTELFSAIDEMVADDADYIKSSAAPVSDTCKISLSNPSSAPAQPFIVMYRYRKAGAAQVDLDVRLLEGMTEIAAWSHTNISGSFVNGEQVLTGGQFAAIGDFDNLFLEFTADAP